MVNLPNFVYTLLQLVIFRSPTTFTSSYVAPSPCLAASDLRALVSCHDSHIIWRNLSSTTYDSIQPAAAERDAWSKTILSLLDVNGDCASVSRDFPEALKSSHTILELGGFCALVETKVVPGDVEGRYEHQKGWGLFVVPAHKDQVKRNVHLSAPHPSDDLGTGPQAGYIFEAAGTRSLYVAGRSRIAFRQQTDCIAGTKLTSYWKTDPAHDKEEMMFETYKAIFEWQKGGCNPKSCAYVQLHGKGKKTCKTDQIFMSSGLGRDPASLKWYANKTNAASPIHRLANQSTIHFPLMNTSLPSSHDSTCPLTATKNIVGRLINGVPENGVCNQPASVEGTEGLFVHIEQSAESRSSENWETWAKVFLDSFEK